MPKNQFNDWWPAVFGTAVVSFVLTTTGMGSPRVSSIGIAARCIEGHERPDAVECLGDKFSLTPSTAQRIYAVCAESDSATLAVLETAKCFVRYAMRQNPATSSPNSSTDNITAGTTDTPAQAATKTPRQATFPQAQKSDTPVGATEPPARATKTPRHATYVPAQPTDVPAQPTDMPAQPTDTPAQATEAPAQATKTPRHATYTPVAATNEPTQVTAAPAQSTDAPEQATDAPQQTTDAPQQATDAPRQATDAPQQTTDAPQQATDVPQQATDAPQQATVTPTPPFVPLVLAAVALGTVVIAIRLPTPNSRREDHVHDLEIESPPNNSIVIAGRATTFTARCDYGDRASAIVWSVASQPGRKAVGATFSHQWTHTGVDQVVASIDGLTCGVIVYVFQTQNGGGTVADLLHATPPPIAISVESFPPLPQRTLRASA